jgi:segregation and condensation protein B
MELEKVKHVLQAVLMVSQSPLTLDKIMDVFDQGEEQEAPSRELVRDALKALEADCEGTGVELKKVASGYRFQVPQGFEPWVAKLYEEKPPRYSRALLETLAIIAYRQPVTRGEIEEIRGVAVSSHITKTLLEREWIRVIGHKDVPGKPALFGTTKEFLDYFNLKSLDELPSLAELRDLESFHPQLELGEDQTEDESAENSEAAEAHNAESAEEIAQEVSEEPIAEGVAQLLDSEENDALDQDELVKE